MGWIFSGATGEREISVFLLKIKSGKSVRGDFSKTLCPKMKGSWLPKSRSFWAHLCYQYNISTYKCSWSASTVGHQWGQALVWVPTGPPALQSSPPRAHAASTWNICVSFAGSCTWERKGLEKGRRQALSPLILETLYLTLLKTIRSAGDFFLKLIQNKNRN